MVCPHQLPLELWIEIFRWVTISSRSGSPYAIAYEPFNTSNVVNAVDPDLSVKSVLVLVCRQWRAIATELLYKDIVIRHGAHALRNVLEGPSENEGYRKWVRRVVLPYESTITESSKSLPSVEILKLCTCLKILVRPLCPLPLVAQRQFEFEADGLPLSSLERLEWWNHTGASESGGINSLDVVLRNAPNLRYLFVGSELGSIGTEPICLHVLQTLHLHLVTRLFIFSCWSLPALTNLVLDSPVVNRDWSVESAWEIFGPQLQTVEFGKHLRFMLDDHLTPCIERCPNLRNLNYYLFFTAPPHLSANYPSLTCIGLNASVNSILAEDESIWSHIEDHFDLYSRQTFPSLERLCLYGEWRGILSHPRFSPLQQAMHAQGYIIELPDGSTQLPSRPWSLDYV